jgi:hypothetical protein
MARIDIGRICGKDGQTAEFVFSAYDAYAAKDALKARGYAFIGGGNNYWTRHIPATEGALKAEIEFGKTLGQVNFNGRPVPCFGENR